MTDPFDWLAHHQDTLTWLGGGVATAAGGVWVAVLYLLDREGKKPEAKPPAAAQPAGHTVSTGIGISAIGDMTIGGNVTIQHSRLPKGAVALAALGLLLLGYAVYNSGNHVTVSNGSYIGGNTTNSPVTVTTPSR